MRPVKLRTCAQPSGSVHREQWRGHSHMRGRRGRGRGRATLCLHGGRCEILAAGDVSSKDGGPRGQTALQSLSVVVGPLFRGESPAEQAAAPGPGFDGEGREREERKEKRKDAEKHGVTRNSGFVFGQSRSLTERKRVVSSRSAWGTSRTGGQRTREWHRGREADGWRRGRRIYGFRRATGR